MAPEATAGRHRLPALGAPKAERNSEKGPWYSGSQHLEEFQNVPECQKYSIMAPDPIPDPTPGPHRVPALGAPKAGRNSEKGPGTLVVHLGIFLTIGSKNDKVPVT